MRIGIVRETAPDEHRVAVVPDTIPSLKALGFEVLLEKGAGTAAGYPDQAYEEKGAEIVSREKLLRDARLLISLQEFGPNGQLGQVGPSALQEDQILVGLFDPLNVPDHLNRFLGKDISGFSLELIPRISRAQDMDILSSMATVAGYHAVLLAASRLPKMFPLLMTAAGTLKPARVLVIGAGVAGLQAISTAKRLGALVTGYDIRPAVREQIESLGAKFLVIDAVKSDAEDARGYAREQSEAQLAAQKQAMHQAVAESDVVITTAAIPGRPAPKLIATEMVRAMAPGSVIVDLAAERGGNCELTKPGEDVTDNGVLIMGPLNVPSRIPYHASQMYSRNVYNFLRNLFKCKKGQPPTTPDFADEIVRETLVFWNGEITNARIRENLKLPPLEANFLDATTASSVR